MLLNKQEENIRLLADLQQKDVVIRQKNVEIQQKDVQLEHHVTTVQQLTSQLREREGRLRQREEELQQKDTQIQQNYADISRLQREIQRLQVGIKIIASYNCVHFPYYFLSLCLQESMPRVTQYSSAEQRPTVKVAMHFITMTCNYMYIAS